MNNQENLNRITTLLSRFSKEVYIQNKNGEYGINIHAENVLIPVLNIIWGCKLENINYIYGKNVPGIDLLDKVKGVAVQVTSEDTIDKIVETLNKANSNYYQCNINQLYIVLLKTQKIKHSSPKINNAIGNLDFSLDKNVIDFSTLYKLICEKNDLSSIIEIRNLLEAQFSDNTTAPAQIGLKYYNLCKTIIKGNLIDDKFQKYDLLQMRELCTDAALYCGNDISEYIEELFLKTMEMNNYKNYSCTTKDIMIERENLRRYFSEQLMSGLVKKFESVRVTS